MKTYLVRIKVVGYYSTVVEAANEDAAEKDALYRYNKDGLVHVDDEGDPEVFSVTEHVATS
jgi:predicted transcriptional regulator